jgi:chain length determinant protein EpsF
MTFQQFALALQARWKMLLTVLLVTVALAITVSLLLPKTYTASTSVVVNVKTPDPVTQQMLPADLNGTYLATQLAVIESPRVAQDVAHTLNLRQSPQMLHDWREATGGRGDFDVWAGGELARHLVAIPSRDSNVITIEYAADDPQTAARVANAFAAAYLDINAQLVAGPAKNFTRWFQARTQALRAQVEKARRAVSDFETEHGVVLGGATDPVDIETSRMQELSRELADAQAKRADTAAAVRAPNGASADLPEVLQNPLITSLKTQIAVQEAQLDQLGRRLGTAHPTYIAAASSLAALRARESAEVQRVVASLRQADRSSQARVTQLQGELAAQKQRVLQLGSTRDQAAVLQADLETAQRDYDAVTQRLAQTSLESQMQQTDVSVLTPAAVPLFPSRPRLWLNTAIAVLVGGLLGLAVVLWQELSDQRLRSASQLAALLGLPVLGIIPLSDDGPRPMPWLPAPRSLPALEWK